MRTGWVGVGYALLSLGLLQCCALWSVQGPADTEAAVLAQWHIQGKLGIRTDQQGTSVLIDWQQRAQQVQIELSGPFGQGRTQIEGDDQGVTLTSADRSYQAETLQALAVQLIDIELPLQHLQYWIQGRPDPQFPAQTRYQGTQLKWLQQSGWQVDYQRYTQIDTRLLPQRIQFQRGVNRGTLIIQRWQLDESKTR